MQLNISYPATSQQKVFEIEDERKLRALYDHRISHEIEGGELGDEFKGYVFRISGGNDKQGFPMKQGVLTASRVRLLFTKGACFLCATVPFSTCLPCRYCDGQLSPVSCWRRLVSITTVEHLGSATFQCRNALNAASRIDTALRAEHSLVARPFVPALGPFPLVLSWLPYFSVCCLCLRF